jgi:plastocyanin
MTHRKMIAGLAGMAVAAGGTGVALAATAPKSVTVAQSDGFKVVPNKYIQDDMRFNKDVYTVKSGGTVKFKLTADQEGPHTFTIVRPKDLPKTAKQVNNCAICQKLGQVMGYDPNTQAPPKFLYLEDGVASNTPPHLNKVGDSAVSSFNKGGVVTLPVTAKPGTTLHFLCLFHPQMQAELKVVK